MGQVRSRAGGMGINVSVVHWAGGVFRDWPMATAACGVTNESAGFLCTDDQRPDVTCLGCLEIMAGWPVFSDPVDVERWLAI